MASIILLNVLMYMSERHSILEIDARKKGPDGGFCGIARISPTAARKGGVWLSEQLKSFQPTESQGRKAAMTWLFSSEDQVQNWPRQLATNAYFSGATSHFDQFTYRWPLCDYANRVELPVHLDRFPILSDSFFITPMGRDLAVVSSDGQVRFRQTMAKHEYWDRSYVPIRSSEREDRIAVNIDQVIQLQCGSLFTMSTWGGSLRRSP